MTNDIDVVVDLPEHRIPELCAAFPAKDFYVSDEAAARAVRTHGAFNVLHPSSGLKVDIIVPEKTLFDHNRFQRIQRVQTGEGLESSFSSAEDVILMKMEFFRRGCSDKHLRDITGILRLRGDRLEYRVHRELGRPDGLGDHLEDLEVAGRTQTPLTTRADGPASCRVRVLEAMIGP